MVTIVLASISVHGFCQGEWGAFGVEIRIYGVGANHYVEFDGIVSDKNLADGLKLHMRFHSFKELFLTRLFLILFCA